MQARAKYLNLARDLARSYGQTIAADSALKDFNRTCPYPLPDLDATGLSAARFETWLQLVNDVESGRRS
jgi:hypothetical protein